MKLLFITIRAVFYNEECCVTYVKGIVRASHSCWIQYLYETIFVNKFDMRYHKTRHLSLGTGVEMLGLERFNVLKCDMRLAYVTEWLAVATDQAETVWIPNNNGKLCTGWQFTWFLWLKEMFSSIILLKEVAKCQKRVHSVFTQTIDLHSQEDYDII